MAEDTEELIFSSIAVLSNYFTLLLIGILTARYGGTEVYANFAFVLSTTMLLSFILEAGASQLIRQFLPVYLQQKQQQKTFGLLLFAVALGFGQAFLVLMVLIFLKGTLNIDIEHFSLQELLICLLISLSLALTRIAAAIINCKGNFLLSSIAYKTIYPLLLLFFIFMALVKNSTAAMNIDYLLNSYLVAVIVTLFFSVCVVAIKGMGQYSGVAFALKSWSKAGLNYAINSITLFASTSVGIIALKLFKYNEHSIAAYAILMALTNILIIFITLTNRFYVPKISVFFHLKQIENINKTLKSRLFFLLCVTGLYWVAMLLFGKVILALYGSFFVDLHLPLISLSMVVIVETIMAIAIFIMIICGAHKKALISQLLMLVMTLILAGVATPFLGLYGALLSFVLPKLSVSFYNSYWLYKNHRIYIFKLT